MMHGEWKRGVDVSGRNDPVLVDFITRGRDERQSECIHLTAVVLLFCFLDMVFVSVLSRQGRGQTTLLPQFAETNRRLLLHRLLMRQRVL